MGNENILYEEIEGIKKKERIEREIEQMGKLTHLNVEREKEQIKKKLIEKILYRDREQKNKWEGKHT